MELHELNTELITQIFVDKVAEIPEIGTNGALLSNPGTAAKFPVCVIRPPISKLKNGGAAFDLSVTIEVWAEGQYPALSIFDKVRIKLKDYNLKLANSTPLFFDAATKKWRYGGYFEVRWNAIDNSFEKN